MESIFFWTEVTWHVQLAAKASGVEVNIRHIISSTSKLKKMFYTSVNVVRLDWNMLSELYTLKRLLNDEMAKKLKFFLLRKV